MSFRSDVQPSGRVTFPGFTGLRLMMMPFIIEDLSSLPGNLVPYAETIDRMRLSGHRGVAYLTIDEAEVLAGQTHRRPGLHVDGVGDDGTVGNAGWGGGGGGGWGKGGMTLASSVEGCEAFVGSFDGQPNPGGCCAHLSDQLAQMTRIAMAANQVYHCGPLTVHRSLPMQTDVRRQFVRVSMPNSAPWFENYTPNPRGVLPTGPILPARTSQMGYRS